MPDAIEQIMLQFTEGYIGGNKHDDPEWLVEKFNVAEQLIQQESSCLKEYEERFNPLMDWASAEKVWGFMLGISFTYEMLKSFRNSGFK